MRILILSALLPAACAGVDASRPSETLWTTLDVPTDDSIVAVKTLRPGTTLVVAAHGGVFLTTDSNRSWTRLHNDLLPRRGWYRQAFFQAAFILDEDHLWAARGYWTDEDIDPFVVYEFSKSRGSWSKLHVQDSHHLRVKAIHFWDARSGILFAYSKHCLKTDDGGKSWSKLQWPVSDGQVLDRDHLFGTGPGRPPASMLQHREGLVYASRSGGERWEPTPQNINEALSGLWTINGIRFLDRRRGWVYGETRDPKGQIRACAAATADGGAQWTPLRDLQIPPKTDYSTLVDLCFRNEQEGWAILNSHPETSTTNKLDVTILGTKDGGINWTEEWSNLQRSTGVPCKLTLAAGGMPIAYGSEGLLLRRRE